MNLYTILKSKIRDITVTDAKPDYEGSVTLSLFLMEQANIKPYEQVQILNANNGARIITYAIPNPENKEVCEINGPACRQFQKGDEIMILTYMHTDNLIEPTVIKYKEWRKQNETNNQTY